MTKDRGGPFSLKNMPIREALMFRMGFMAARGHALDAAETKVEEVVPYNGPHPSDITINRPRTADEIAAAISDLDVEKLYE